MALEDFMIGSFLFGVGFVSGCIFCFYAGLYSRDVAKKIEELLSRPKDPEPTPFVTHTERGFVNENTPLRDDSAIVLPKTPQRLEFEEQEELRKMNLGSQ